MDVIDIILIQESTSAREEWQNINQNWRGDRNHGEEWAGVGTAKGGYPTQNSRPASEPYEIYYIHQNATATTIQDPVSSLSIRVLARTGAWRPKYYTRRCLYTVSYLCFYMLIINSKYARSPNITIGMSNYSFSKY